MKRLLGLLCALLFSVPAMSANVPNGYTELEYIQSDRNAYIDTDVKWKSGYKIQLDLTSISSSGNYAFFGASNGAAYNNGEVAVWWNKGKFDRVIPTSNSVSLASQFGTYANNTRYLVTYDKNATTGNSDSMTNEGFYDTYVGTNNIFLFGTHRTAGDVGNAPFKLHSVKMWDENGSLIRNFIPAKDSRGTVGMYDTVEGKFYENQGTGTFTVGPAIKNLLDNSTFEYGKHYTGVGTIDYYAGRTITQKFSVKDIDTIAIKFLTTESNVQTALVAWDENGNMLDRITTSLGAGVTQGTYDVSAYDQVAFFWWNQASTVGSPGAISNVMVVEGDTPRDYIPYTQPIRIATSKFTTAAFSDVVSNLNTAVATIKDVVTNTINQATAVANLQSGKQTKPTDTCPNGKICLLVEDEAGTLYWYEIIERAPGIVPAGSGYTQVEYLQSSGTQYIDTGFKFTNPNVLIESKVDFVVSPGNSEQDIISTYSADVATGMAVGYSGVWFQYSRGDNNVTYSTNPVGTHVISAEYNFASNTKRFSLDGGDRSGGYANTIVSDKTAKLFSNGNGNGYFLVGKMYYLKIHENGSLVRDFVPARRNSDGVLGMYDTVSGNFFTNAGTGEFTAPGYLPASYTQLTYLQSDGNQWIDTGINGFDSGEWEIYAKWMATASTQPNNYGFIFGVYKGENYNSYRLIFSQTSSVNYYVSSNSKAGGGSILVNAAINTVHEITVQNGAFTLDGTNYTAANRGDTLPAAATLGIFTTGRAASPSYTAIGLGRIYEMRVTKNGVLVANFIPAQNSSGVLGMYDLVNNQFYTNQGSGTFTAGPAVQ